MQRVLETRGGRIQFPAFLPVTTFGGRFPLDDLLRPYLKRFATGVMVSHFYAQKMKGRLDMPVFIDSGGFASLFKGSEILEDAGTAAIRTADGSVIDPEAVLAFQQKHADVGATLDFLVRPGLEETESLRRHDLTIRNALWAIRHRKKKDLRLYASLQAWNAASATRTMEALAPYPFDGFALGGMVPRIRKPQVIFDIVARIRAIDDLRPLHVFGIGQPALIRRLFDSGVDSVDSSSYAQQAVGKKYLDPERGTYTTVTAIASPADICPCRVCQTFSKEYLLLEGELNNMALVLHNLFALNRYVSSR